eukprot:164373_1
MLPIQTSLALVYQFFVVEVARVQSKMNVSQQMSLWMVLWLYIYSHIEGLMYSVRSSQYSLSHRNMRVKQIHLIHIMQVIPHTWDTQRERQKVWDETMKQSVPCGVIVDLNLIISLCLHYRQQTNQSVSKRILALYKYLDGLCILAQF